MPRRSNRNHSSISKNKIKRALSRRHSKKDNTLNVTDIGGSTPSGIPTNQGSLRQIGFANMIKAQDKGTSAREMALKYPMTPNAHDFGPPEFGGVPGEGIDHEGVNTGYPRMRTLHYNPGSPCHFNCFGSDVIVKPGDCILCPEEAYCPDNLKCSTSWQAGQNYFNSGWACCGCAADYNQTGPGTKYGQRLGDTYTMWLGNGKCNDGGYRETYYLCTEETCGPSDCSGIFGPDNCGYCGGSTGIPCSTCCGFPQIDNWGTPDGNHYLGGPWTVEQHPALSDGHSTDYIYDHTFYWAKTPPAGEYETAYFSNPNTGNNPYGWDFAVGWGSLKAHLACAEWGWDCGDVLNDNCGTFSSDPDDWIGDMEFNFTMANLPDPNKHCNFVRNMTATCEHKCNRDYYKHDAGTGNGIMMYSAIHNAEIPTDPGGFAYTSQDTDEWSSHAIFGVCYCDNNCPACGCDPVQFCGAGGCTEGTSEMQFYKDCLSSCPGNCLSPRHQQAGMTIPFDTEYGQWSLKTGVEPGLDCSTTNLGDCCDDWKTQCWLPYPELPCECYDQLDTSVGQSLIWPNEDCLVASGANDCVYSGPTTATCSSEEGCAQTCEQHCNDLASNGIHVDNASWWAEVNTLQNHACTVWNYNMEIRQEPDMSQWYYTPTCVPVAKTSGVCQNNSTNTCSDCDNGTCNCDCVCFHQDSWEEIIDFASNANVGCNDPLACNQVIDQNNETPNCSREDVERYGVQVWNEVVGPYGSIVNDSVGVPYCQYPAGSSGATMDCSQFENEEMCNSIYTDQGQICQWFGDPLNDCKCADHNDGDTDNTHCPLQPWLNITTEGDDYIITGSDRPEWDVIHLYTWMKTYEDALSSGLIGLAQLWSVFSSGTQVGTVHSLYLERIEWIESGCKGCPDPNAGNYTGHINRELYSGAPFDADGNTCPGTFSSMGVYSSAAGESCNTAWCYYETGCGDPTATNYLSSNENDNNGFNRGGLVSPFSTAAGNNQYFPFLITDFQTMLGYVAGSDYEDWGSSSPYIMCQAPNGCAQWTTNNPGQPNDHASACTYSIVNFCGNDQACNYSADCAPAMTETGGVVYETTVDGVAYTCGEHQEGLCLYSITYCQDIDGDGLPGDVATARGCDMTGSVFGGADLTNSGPDDARTPQCTGCYSINPDCTGTNDESLSCNNYELIGGAPTAGGYPFIPCAATLGGAANQDPLVSCSTNKTHEDFCLGADILGQSVVPAVYQHNGEPFSITDCCSDEGCCATGSCDTYDGGGAYSATLPCCYRDDDCGNCKPTNTGLFVVRENGIYQDENSNPLPFVQDTQDETICISCGQDGCIADTNQIFDSNGYVQGVVRMESSDSQGVYFCNCAMETQLGCNCDQGGLNSGAACGAGGTLHTVGCDDVCQEDATQCVGCCDDEAYPCGYNFGDAEFPDFVNDCDCNYNQLDCLGVCGGTYVLGSFYRDADNDDYCVSGIVCDGTNAATCNEMHDFCYDSTDVAGTRPAAAQGKWLLETECQPTGMSSITQDQDDTIDCESNVIDDCGICDGTCIEGVPYSCDLIGCSGLCPQSGGDLDYINSCGYCINPVGGGLAQQSNSNGYINPVTGLNFEYGMDQCGLCPPSQDGASGNVVGSSYQIFNSIQIPIEITYGSFGCENNQYFDPSFFEGDWETGCNVRHCACQCAGCTNPGSPAWNPYALYSVSSIFGQNNNSSTYTGYNWMLAEVSHPIIANMHTDQYTGIIDDFCDSSGENEWHLCTNRTEMFNDLYDAYSYLCNNPGDPFCVLNESYTAGLTLPNGMSGHEYWESLQATCWRTHAGLKFQYCYNTTTNNSACAGLSDHNGNPIVVDGTCSSQYGAWCCSNNLGDQDHCRVGVRSEMVWDVIRGGGVAEDILEWSESGTAGTTPGDVNYDGIVNIQDIIQIVNVIMSDGSGSSSNFNFTFTDAQRYLADLNNDGTLDILDVIGMLNLILQDRRRSVGFSDTSAPISQSQKRDLIKSLKPLFRNSVHTRMRARHNGSWLVSGNTRVNETITWNTISRTRGDYDMNFFNFLFNAPTCIDTTADGSGFLTNAPHIEYGDYSNILNTDTGEYGPNFNVLPWQVTKFTAVDGQDYMMIGLGQTGQNIDLSVSINDEYMLMSIWHPNVHVQTDPLLRQLGGTIQGNAMYFIPGSGGVESYCTNIPSSPEMLEECEAIGEQTPCDEHPRCQWLTEYADVPIYDTYGIFGYYWDYYNADSCLSGDCVDSFFYWLPRQHQCIPNGRVS